MRRFIPILLAILPLAGCTSKEKPADPPLAAASAGPVKVDDVALSYIRLTLMTKEPVRVDPTFAAMCAPPFHDTEEENRKYGPHARTAVKIYMSDAAAKTFLAGGTAYPVDSVVVKEKQPVGGAAGKSRSHRKNADDPNAVPAPEPKQAVGGMIKRAPGYDPAHGDWEYFYFAAGGKIESGRIESCVNCHAAAASKGYVYGDWAR